MFFEGTIYQALRDIDGSDVSKKVSSIYILAKIHHPAILERLDHLLDHKDSRIRASSAYACGILSTPDSTPRLISLLEDEHYLVRSACVVALGRLRIREASPRIINCLNDRESLVRANSAYSLGLIGDDYALPYLAKRLTDTERCWASKGERVCDAVATALRLINTRESLSILYQWQNDQSRSTPTHTPSASSHLKDDAINFDDPLFDQMAWLESLAARQGADPNEFMTAANYEIPEIDSNSVVIDEPGYVPYALFETAVEQAFASTESHQSSDLPILENTTGFVPMQDEVLAASDFIVGYAESGDDWAVALDEEYDIRHKSLAQDAEPDWYAEAVSKLEDGTAEALPEIDTILSVMPIETEIIAPEPTDLPDWLQEMSSPAVPSDSDLPAWLIGSPVVEVDEMTDVAMPDWLSESVLDPLSFAEAVAPPVDVASQEEHLPSGQEGNLPAWHRQVSIVDSTVEQHEPDKIDIMRGVTTPSSQSSDGIKTVHFTAFYPNETEAERLHSLYVYAHLPDAVNSISQDVQQFRDKLGNTTPLSKIAKQWANLPEGTLITVVPECEDVEFEPVSITKKWSGSWKRFEFDFTPSINLIGETLLVRVSIQVCGLEIACIKLSVEVEANVVKADNSISAARIMGQPAIQNPLAAAKLARQTARIYQKIFISYSRQDTQVVEAYRQAQLALGNEVFMDTYSIRSGENWRAALAEAIDSADIFQLFWSENAITSENIRDEWRYAIIYRCPDTRCDSFIRPIFWKKPVPPPPPELSHLNFRYIELVPVGIE